tara:strand:- start:727 stop:834 length:108 start_codon:yes stop_codon:yes gene_type:complete
MNNLLLKVKKVVVENWPVVVGAGVLFLALRHCGAL